MKTLLAVSLLISFAALGLVIRSTLSGNENAIASSAALKSELVDTQRRLRTAEDKLATLSTLVDTMQMRSTSPTSKEEGAPLKAANQVSLPSLIGGSYTLENDAVVYDSDAKLHLANDVIISSPTGVMVSDLNQKIVVGDLTMETPRGTMHADGAVVDVSQQRVTATNMRFTATKVPIQSSVPTVPNVRGSP